MEKSGLKKILEREVKKLMEISESYAKSEIAIHEIESGLLQQVLAMCLSILKWIISERLKTIQDYDPDFQAGTYYKSKGNKTRTYLSLFGMLKIDRPSYWSESCHTYFKLDESLQLPVGRSWSYNLQELISEQASENDYRESVKVINRLLGLNLSGKSSQRNANFLGPAVEDFYNQKPVEEENSDVCFCASFDGKGVRKIEKVIDPKERLKKGEKKGVKQNATVTSTSCFRPKRQSVERILNGLLGKSDKDKKEETPCDKTEKTVNDNRWHKGIHRRAFLANQEKAIDYGINDIKMRMKNPKSRFVVPIDGGVGLEDQVKSAVKKYGLEFQFDGIIMDIIHVSEYVWDAATAILGERSNSRSSWVRDMMNDLLNSKTQKVIDDLKQIADKTNLSDSKKKKIEKAITYFSNHKHKMDYLKFIKKGYPISSALAESTCGHLVKERMEQSGMKWSSQGAQNIMDLRAVKINGDMEDFMKYIIQQDRKVDLVKIAA